MIRTLLKLAFFLVIGLVGYNYFFGTEEEKESSREIVGKAKDLGTEAWNLLKSERKKVDQGKYDEALDRLEILYTDLRQEADRLGDSKVIEELRELSGRRHELEESLGQDDDLSRRAQRELDALTEETEELMHEMEEKSRPGAPY